MAAAGPVRASAPGGSSGEHAADTARRLRGTKLPELIAELAAMTDAQAVELLEVDDFHHASEALERLPPERAVRLLEAMSADRAADALRWMPAAARDRLECSLAPETRADLETILTFPPDSAGSLMTTEFVSVLSGWNVGRVMDHVRSVEYGRETIYAIYVLEEATRRLLGAVGLRRLVVAEPDAPLLSLAEDRRLIAAAPATDREEVARLISRCDLLAIPFVDDAGRMLGIVTVDDVLTALVEEQSEDIQKLGGMEALDEPYWESSLLDIVRKRAGWLVFLFVSGMLTATAMQYFEGEIEKAVVLAVFIPLVMSSGGNSGSPRPPR
jgi:magnesium transporter